MFYGDKMYTDFSKTAPETSNRLITMGTVLERMDELAVDELVSNRLPMHNYAVYLPVRNEDGSYGKVPALINAKEMLSEDYLPLTGANLATVSLASLGDAYGWGATLNNEDCTSLNRTVFCCFGLDLPRNDTWQKPLAMPKADTEYWTTEEKLAALDVLPLGTILNFPGHQMMYLGAAGGEYYVVSTVSSIINPETGERQRLRSVSINTVELRCANGKTWVQAVDSLYIPWIYCDKGADDGYFPSLPWYHEGTAFCLKHDLMDVGADRYFRPEADAAISDILETLCRIAGRPEPMVASADMEESTTPASLRRAEQEGLTDGDDPTGPLTWDKLFAILNSRLEALDRESSAEPASADAGGETASSELEALFSGELMRARAAGGTVTRGELAMVLRFAFDALGYLRS